MKNVVLKNITDKADELARLYNKTKDEMMTTTIVEFKKKEKKSVYSKRNCSIT